MTVQPVKPDGTPAAGKPGMRRDIQGLRALAVGLVIVDHAGFRSLSGGYVGVDVFFVVSAFLIVGILVREIDGTGRISISDFYARRARRIVPAASVVLAVALAVGTYELPSLRALELQKDVVWSALFGANFRFSSVETDYFAQGDPPSIVQHYWSLSVEEQFYLVVPLLLLLVALVARRRRTALLGVLGLITVASFAYSIHITDQDVKAAYFSTPARAWELGLGGLLAVLVAGRRPSATRNRWAEAAGVIGLVAILTAALTFDASTPVPGYHMLLPVLGTLLVLGAGTVTSSTVAGRMLGIAPLRSLGDWSFSLYLWHFPVLRLGRSHLGGDPELWETAMLLALTLVLSVASYYLIEEPFRRGIRWRPRWRAIALYPGGVAVVLVALLGSHLWVNGQLHANDDNPAITAADYRSKDLSHDPAVALVEASTLAARAGRPIPGDLVPGVTDIRQDTAPLGECDYRTGTQELCNLGAADPQGSIVVIGDSHARAWGPAVTAIAEASGKAAYQFVYSGCPANTATRPDPANGEPWTACRDFKAWSLQQVQQLQPDLVIVSNLAYSQAALDKDQLVGLREELEALRAHAAHVVLVGNTPVLSGVPGACLSRRHATLRTCLMTASKRQAKQQRAFFGVARDAGVSVIDAMKWFCSAGECPAVVGRTITMRDSQHMTTAYARELAAPLARRLRQVTNLSLRAP